MFTFILAQANILGSPIILIAFMAMLYLFMIYPQQKKQKEAKKFLGALKVGDRVVTIGGQHGTITKMDELTVELEIARGMRSTFDRSAINMDSTKRVSGGTAVVEEKAAKE